ncbi:MAG: ABC transporter ATP-binding protein [Candidatus Diapherotrites archaeon]|nr:ABC transporter ATP-binding protein [Candidatus Diapherotrites archaeon]
MNKEIVSIENISFNYSGEKLLENVSLKIYEKDFVGIVGPNGGGKTTLLKLILGLLKPVKGKITVFNSTPLKGRTKIGYLSQHEYIDFDFPVTVKEIVLMSRMQNKLFKNYSEQDLIAAENALNKMKLLEMKGKKLNELSGGEKQRVFIARALASNPELLVLDEPLNNVDIFIQKDLYELLVELNKEMAIIVVDHNTEMLSKYVKEIACVNKCMINSVDYHKIKKISGENSVIISGENPEIKFSGELID